MLIRTCKHPHREILWDMDGLRFLLVGWWAIGHRGPSWPHRNAAVGPEEAGAGGGWQARWLWWGADQGACWGNQSGVMWGTEGGQLRGWRWRLEVLLEEWWSLGWWSEGLKWPRGDLEKQRRKIKRRIDYIYTLADHARCIKKSRSPIQTHFLTAPPFSAYAVLFLHLTCTHTQGSVGLSFFHKDTSTCGLRKPMDRPTDLLISRGLLELMSHSTEQPLPFDCCRTFFRTSLWIMKKVTNTELET